MTHVSELTFTENNLAAVMLALAVKEKRPSAIAFSKGLCIPRNNLPPTTRPVEVISGKPLIVLSSIMAKPRKRKDIANETGMNQSAVANAIKALFARRLIRVVRKVMREGNRGNSISVYGPTEAGRKSVEAVE